MQKKDDGEKHNAIVEKFNFVVDFTSSFVKSIFPQTIKFVFGIKDIFSKKENPSKNKN